MLNVAVFKAIEKNLKHLIINCGNCDMILQCEEREASGDYDFEPRYCKSIIEAAVMNELNFRVPFPKGENERCGTG